MKKLLCLVIMLICAFAFAGCGESEKDVVTFGILGPFTGTLQVYGSSVKEGALLAIEDLNANGGILGKEVVGIYEDDEGDSKQVISAYSRMADDIDFLIGEVTSGNTETIAAQINIDKMPTITPSATAAGVTKEREYMFRTCFLDPTQGETMAEFAKEKLNVSKVAVVYDNSDDYSKGVASAFVEKAKELGIEVKFNDGGLVAGDNDQRNTIINKLKDNSEIDAIFAPIYYQDAALLAQGLRKAGNNLPLLGADGFDGILSQLAGTKDYSSANNVYFTNHYCSSEESMQEFITKYENKYGKTPTSFAALAYDSVMMAAQAMESAQTTDKETVKTTLQNGTYLGLLTGDIKFDANGDPIKTVYICKYVDGNVTLADKYNK